MLNCELCRSTGGELIWENTLCSVVRVSVPDYPGFCRIISKAHISEMTDLTVSARNELMQVVFATETALRRLYRPDKINLASLGNVVPHLHWHVIPRWRDDTHFPNPIWATPVRNTEGAAPRPDVALDALQQELIKALP